MAGSQAEPQPGRFLPPSKEAAPDGPKVVAAEAAGQGHGRAQAGAGRGRKTHTLPALINSWVNLPYRQYPPYGQGSEHRKRAPGIPVFRLLRIFTYTIRSLSKSSFQKRWITSHSFVERGRF